MAESATRPSAPRRPDGSAPAWQDTSRLPGKMLLLVLVTLLAPACGQGLALSSTTAPDSSHITGVAGIPGAQPHKNAKKQHHKKVHHKIAKPTPRPRRTKKPSRVASCPPPSRVMLGVYHPERLVVLDGCKHASGVVTDIRTEEDGDLHVLVHLDPAFRHLVNGQNRDQQHGWLVVELTPRDHGRLPAPYVHERIGLLGAWVTDTDHGWREIHPVWQETLHGHAYVSGPFAGGSPPYDRSADALEGCRTARGKRCIGYGGGDSSGGGGGDEGGPGGGRCTPGYKPCLTPASDYDCVGGGGDGPRYVQGPVYVTGSDPYNLDGDGDGVACAG